MAVSAVVSVCRFAGFGLLATILLSGEVGAIWAPMTLEQLVKQSELIVIGPLVAIREAGAGDIGTIRVEEVLRSGTIARTAASVSLALPSRRRLVPSSAVFYEVGQRGIWFLRLDTSAPQPLFVADHPHRFKSTDEAEKVRAFIKTFGR